MNQSFQNLFIICFYDTILNPRNNFLYFSSSKSKDHIQDLNIGPMKDTTTRTQSRSRSAATTRRKVPNMYSSSSTCLSAIVEEESKVDCIDAAAPATLILLQVHHSSIPITRRTPKTPTAINVKSNVVIEKTHGRMDPSSKKDIQDFLRFIRILLMRIKRKNTLVYDYTKKVLRQCIVMNRGHPELLRWSIEKRLRAIVGGAWNETERALYSKVSS